jgi:hypothetical protein
MRFDEHHLDTHFILVYCYQIIETVGFDACCLASAAFRVYCLSKCVLVPRGTIGSLTQGTQFISASRARQKDHTQYSHLIRAHATRSKWLQWVLLSQLTRHT